MAELAIVLWLALASCQGEACGPGTWAAVATFPSADRCEAVAERASGDALCLPRGWTPLADPGAPHIARTWQART